MTELSRRRFLVAGAATVAWAPTRAAVVLDRRERDGRFHGDLPVLADAG
jgi:hypothetical protein